MPAVIRRASAETQVFVFFCEGCGEPASFGVDCDLRKALATHDVAAAGRWFCGWDGTHPVCKKGQGHGQGQTGTTAQSGDTGNVGSAQSSG